MTMNADQVRQDIEKMFGQVPDWIDELPPSALEGFWKLMRDFDLGETKIPNKYKELIGLAVSGATRCRYCALFHTEAARMHGATDDEIAEAAGVGAMTMFASTFMNGMMSDYDTFVRQTREMIAFAQEHAEQLQPPPDEPPGEEASPETPVHH